MALMLWNPAPLPDMTDAEYCICGSPILCDAETIEAYWLYDTTERTWLYETRCLYFIRREPYRADA